MVKPTSSSAVASAAFRLPELAMQGCSFSLQLPGGGPLVTSAIEAIGPSRLPNCSHSYIVASSLLRCVQRCVLQSSMEDALQLQPCLSRVLHMLLCSISNKMPMLRLASTERQW